MDVSLPIASAVPSLDGPVLVALASTRAPLTLSAVHRLAARGSLQGVRRVLLRQVVVGLVHQVPGGFVLNRDHLAAPAVEQLAALHGELMKRLRDAVSAWRGSCSLLALYGSAARRDGDDGSDIDVLFVSGAADASRFAEDLAARIELWTGNHAHVVTLAPDELRRAIRAREPIVEAWRRDLLVVAGSDADLRAAGKR